MLTATDIYVLLKRMEAVRAAIALQDEDDIATQTVKFDDIADYLDDVETAMEAAWITELLKNGSFGEAMKCIETLTHRLEVNVKHTPPEAEGLRTEIALLNGRVGTLEQELNELEKTMYEFDMLQTREVGELALRVLTFKRRKAASRVAMGHDEQAEQDLRDAEMEEERYKGAYEKKLKLMHSLTDAEMKELKMLFNRIAKLTHPDLVDKRYEREAVALFRRAKEAKDINDLATIKEIHDLLMSGKPFKHQHESLSEMDSLRREAKNMRIFEDQLQRKIAVIKNSEAYQNIVHIPDWNAHFQNVRTKMLADLEMMQAPV